MAGHPLRPATDRRLGRPLPYQLANRTWAHPAARARKPPFTRRSYAVLARVSPGCPPLQGRFPRFTHPSATLLRPKPFRVRLACVKHAASVQSEPGSNSSVQSLRSPIGNQFLARRNLQSLEDARRCLWNPPRHHGAPTQVISTSFLKISLDQHLRAAKTDNFTDSSETVKQENAPTLPNSPANGCLPYSPPNSYNQAPD